MKIENFKRIIKEDVDEQFRPLVDKLGFSINTFAEQVIKILNNNLTFTDNFNSAVKDVTVVVDSSGTPTIPLQIKTGLSVNSNGLMVIRATNLTSSTTYPTGYPFISYNESGGLITVNNIKGLPANNQFKLKIVVLV